MTAKTTLLATLAITAALLAAPATAASAADPSTVAVSGGTLRGTVTSSHRSFQGIPYAAPPVGDLRWTAPQAARPWPGTRDATQPGAPCAQEVSMELSDPSTTEDCLYLNVTTPRTTARRLPVMVFVHGGSLTYGSGRMYDARRLASQGNAVVVTINYRLGAFGFLAHPALGPGSGNYGIQDQQAALRWVRANATAFGGDARNVTVFGESGGGHSICSHLASPSSAGLFDRAIIQSAPCNWTRTQAEAETQGQTFASTLGCSEAACLRATPTDLVLAKAGRFAQPTIAARPHLGTFASGRFNRVPVMVGVNRDEEQLRVGGTEAATGHHVTASGYEQAIRAQFPAKATEILARYPLTSYATPGAALSAVQTDPAWVKPSYDITKALAAHTAVHMYEFSEQNTPWFAGFGKPSFAPGAYHTAELPFLFDTSWTEPLTEAQKPFAQHMITSWTGFARTGQPGWCRFTTRTPYVQALASTGSARTDLARTHHLDLWS
ncbi:carboxylesterase/lipase family protein [Longispora albida]|uniref:carboxylesterase/lipase family protein n=1 Tax=Longispora albida TaxID=203523 RepID=UPI00036C3FDF|nr:carboxylesterase family protein [Longispora albida]